MSLRRVVHARRLAEEFGTDNVVGVLEGRLREAETKLAQAAAAAEKLAGLFDSVDIGIIPTCSICPIAEACGPVTPENYVCCSRKLLEWAYQQETNSKE